MQLSTVTQKGQVTIPASIRKRLGILAKEKVAFIEKDNSIVIKPAPNFYSLKGSVKNKKKYEDKKADKAIAKFIAAEYATEINNS